MTLWSTADPASPFSTAPPTSSHSPNGGDLTNTENFPNAQFLIINRLALLLV
jgi:hypothetical protein